MKAYDFHITLNIAGKAYAATGYGWQTSRGTYQPGISIRPLHTMPYGTGTHPRNLVPAALTRHRFRSKADAAKCANDYLDRAAAQVVADFRDNEAEVISPYLFDDIELKGSQWKALAEMAGTDSTDDWHTLPDDKHKALVAQAAEYLQANATDITGLEIAPHNRDKVKEMAQ